MTKAELVHLWETTKPWEFHRVFGEYLKGIPDFDTENAATEQIEGNKRKSRTLTQNKAMWKEHQLVADELTKQGVTMRKVFESTTDFDIPPTKDNVHELWLYFQKIMYPSMPSTKDLPKHGDHYQKIHDVMMKNLGEKFGIDYVDFPHEKNKGNDTLAAHELRKKMDYDDDYKEPLV